MIISSLAMCRISNYELTTNVVHLAQQAGLNITLSQNPKIDFLVSRPNYYLVLTYGLLLKKNQLKFFLQLKHL